MQNKNKFYRLFVDDIRNPNEVSNYMLPFELRKEYVLHNWVVVRDYVAFVKHISNNGLPTHISFDHDLADEHNLEENVLEKTGYDCAKWLIDYLIDNSLKLPLCYVHSMNPIGK